MVTELLQSIDKYTIAQLLAATPMLFVVWLIIREINGVMRGGNKNQMLTAFETIGMVAGRNQELTDKLAEVGQSVATVSNNQDSFLKTQDRIVVAIERIFTMFSDNNKEDEQARKDIAALKADSVTHKQELENTNQVVQVMSDDVESIKSTIDEIKQKVDRLVVQQENGERLSKQHQDTLDLILEKLNNLKPETEAPVVDIPVKPRGVPVAPKPEVKEKAND
jgi:chromosome segregation ATPase